MQSNTEKSKNPPERPKILVWLLTLNYIGFYTDSYEKWKIDAEAFFRYDYFESNTRINTPLEWIKNLLSDSYKTSGGNAQQIIVLLLTALLTSGLWGGLIITPQTVSLNTTYVFWIFIALYIFVNIRWKFKHDINEAKMRVVLAHHCTDNCRENHFPTKQ